MTLLKSKINIGIFLVALLTIATSTTLFAQVNDAEKTIDVKAKDLVSQMTSEEKISYRFILITQK